MGSQSDDPPLKWNRPADGFLKCHRARMAKRISAKIMKKGEVPAGLRGEGPEGVKGKKRIGSSAPPRLVVSK